MKKFYNFLLVLLMIILVGILGIVVIMTVDDCASTEVERYSIGMEITHAEETTYYIRNYGTKTKRTFYLRGDDKVITVNVDGKTYARFKQGDWVEVEIRVIEGAIFHEIEEKAQVIGAMKN